jgi:flagellin-like hook-associated protein FlgL
MVSLANTKVEDRFLFAGFKNGAAPFSATGAYLGDNGTINIQTGTSSSVAINLLGNQVFQGAGVNGGVGVLDALKDLRDVLNGGGSGTAPLSLGLAVNLDATATTPASAFPVGPDDTPANWQAGSNFSTSVRIFDSLGTGHDLTFLFRKTGATTWDYQAVAKRSELDATAPTSTDWRQVSSGTLDFNAGGTFNAAGSTVNAVGPLAWVNGAASQTIAATDMNFTGSTQLTEPSAVLTLNQTNTAGFATEIGRLDAALEHIDSFRAEVGARLNAANTTKDGIGLLKTQTQIQRGKIEGADVFQLYSDFSRAQQAFQAALQSAAKVTQTSLLDFLR